MENPLKNLKIDEWYKASLVLGAAVFILSLTIKLKGVDNSTALLISLGLILVSLGEWINHPLQACILPPGRHFPGWLKGIGYPRKNSLLGLMLECLGVVLVVIGIVKSMWS